MQYYYCHYEYLQWSAHPTVSLQVRWWTTPYVRYIFLDTTSVHRASREDVGHHLPRQPPVPLCCLFRNPGKLPSSINQGGDCVTVVPGILCPLCKWRSLL